MVDGLTFIALLKNCANNEIILLPKMKKSVSIGVTKQFLGSNFSHQKSSAMSTRNAAMQDIPATNECKYSTIPRMI